MVLQTGSDNGIYLTDGTTIVDSNGNIDAPVTTTNLTTTGDTTLGNNVGVDTLQVNAAATFNGTTEFTDPVTVSDTLTVGVDDTGFDVKLFGATAGKSFLWDESADKMIVTGTADIDGTLTMLSGRGIASSVATALVPFVLAAAMSNTTDTAAVSVANYYTTLTTTGAAIPTLADGSVVGQMKKIEMLVDGGDAVLTPANLAGGTTITFADVGDVAELIWNGNDWVAIALYNTVDGATAPVLG